MANKKSADDFTPVYNTKRTTRLGLLQEMARLRRQACGAVYRAVEIRHDLKPETEKFQGFDRILPGIAGMKHLSSQLNIPLDEISLWEVQQGVPEDQVHRVKRVLRKDGYADWADYQIRPGQKIAEHSLKIKQELRREGIKC